MITPRGTLDVLGATCLLVATSMFQPSFTVDAAENQLRQVGGRIALDQARPVERDYDGVSRPQSTVARAARGEVLNDLPAQPLDGSLVRGETRIRQVGYFDDCGSRCGPVCDCGDPGCGVEAVCGLEPGNIEVGPSCGVEGCTDCYESVCGAEALVAAGPDCGCDACQSGCEVDCYPIWLPMLRVNWARFEFFAGVQGFKGPMNFASTNPNIVNEHNGSGSFGFYQGFNEGRSLDRWYGCGLAAQFGLRATQSNLSGAEFTDEARHQVFLSGGLFRRVDYGLQYGLVLDYLNDDWYFQANLLQIRSEYSWNHGNGHVWGFQWMAGLDSATSDTIVRNQAGTRISSSVSFEPTDQYRFFYRRMLHGDGSWNAFGGFTDNDDGLVGCDLTLPLRRCLTLQTGATFLVPNEGNNSGGNEQESWNIALGLVYRPGGKNCCEKYSRPMFDVADNGTFMVDRL